MELYFIEVFSLTSIIYIISELTRIRKCLEYIEQYHKLDEADKP